MVHTSAYRSLAEDAMNVRAVGGLMPNYMIGELVAAVIAMADEIEAGGGRITRDDAAAEIETGCWHSDWTTCMTCRQVAKNMREGRPGWR